MAKKSKKKKKGSVPAYGTPEFWKRVAAAAGPRAVPQKKGRGWPLYSDALACHPDQVDAMNQRNADAGISVRYDRTDGRAIIPDRGERRKLLKREGVHDRDGGYGDG